jgi:hypothetical protein
MRAKRLWLIAAATAALWAAPASAGAQQLLSDPFSGATTSSPLVSLNSNSPGFPCLTAGTDTTSTPVAGCGLATPDPVGSGVLRLTDANIGEAAGVLYDASFPTSAGLDITFDQYQYGGNGADGISFDLAVSPPQPTAIGPSGGSLGYSTQDFSTPMAGLPGGYLGIGLDTFGNFSNPSFDGSGCTAPSWAGASPNQVTARGPGDGTAGYCLLSSSDDGTQTDQLGASGPIQLSSSQTTRDAPEAVSIKINPTANTYTVGIDPTGGTNYQTVTSGSLPTSYFDPTTGASVSGIPPRLTFAFAASTGSFTDVHEISNVTANTINGSVPVLTLSNTASLGAKAPAGSPDTYQLVAGVSAQSPAPENSPSSIQVTDPIPAGETLAGSPSGTGWNCSASTAALVSCTNTTTAALAPGATLPAISVPVTISAGATGQIVNTAQVISSDAAAVVSGSDTLIVAATVPSVTPGQPSVTAQGAVFTATVDPEGAATTVFFEYGLDPKYGLTTLPNIY